MKKRKCYEVVLVSDIHIGGGHNILSNDIPPFVDLLNYFSDDNRPIDHMLIAGDIARIHSTYENTIEDLEEFRDELKERGWYDGKFLSIVPGNHEYRTFGILPRDRISSEFRNKFRKLHDNLVKDYIYPWAKNLPNVYLVALDTGFESGILDIDKGRFGEDQIIHFERIIKSQWPEHKYLCILIHHTPDEIKDFAVLKEIIEDEYENPEEFIVFACGHKHRNLKIEPYDDEFDAPGWVISGSGWDKEDDNGNCCVPILRFYEDAWDCEWEDWLEVG